jgi:hypothetical protein
LGIDERKAPAENAGAFFTASKNYSCREKVEIARRIEEAMAGRVGRPSASEKEIPQRVAELKGKESADIAAEAVGWSGEQ